MRRIAALLLLSACDEAPVVAETSLLANTFDTEGPYRVTTVVRDPDGVDRVYLFWRRFGRSAGEAPGDFFPQPLAGRDDVFEGAIPGTGAPDYTVEYYVQAEDAGVVATDPVEARGEPGVFFSFDVVRPYGGCAENDDCGPGEVCDEAFCSPAAVVCAGDGDCPTGHVCDAASRCRPAVRACAGDDDCLISEVCDASECGARPPCEQDAQCPDEFACNEGLGWCVRTCEDDGDCGSGRACEGGACVPSEACEDDGDCPGGEACDLDGVCREEGAGPGAPCGSDADCGGPTDYCLYDVEADQLVCGADCAEEPCPEGFACEPVAEPPQCVPEDATP